jgi:hypothetical protein
MLGEAVNVMACRSMLQVKGQRMTRGGMAKTSKKDNRKKKQTQDRQKQDKQTT